MNLSDNLTHVAQLIAMLAAMVALIIYAPSIPPEVTLAAFAPVISGLLGAKLALTAVNNGSPSNPPSAAAPPSVVPPAAPVVATPPAAPGGQSV